MGYYIPSSNCSGTTVPDYDCNDCPSIEYGRIRSVAFVKKSYYSTLYASPTSTSVWMTGIQNGSIIVLARTSGSYDGGTTQELVGFGDDATMNGNTTHTAEVMDANYKNNCDFWNAIKNSSEYSLVYRTSSLVHFVSSTGATVTITPNNPVADDINSVVGWKAKLKWTNADSPCSFSVPTGIFTNCIVHS